METKELVAFALLLCASVGGVAVTCVSIRAREAAFFFLIAGAVLSDKLDVNFFSQFWYRGSTRGIEVSFLDVLAFSVLASSVLAPRERGPRRGWPAGLLPLLLFAGWAGISVAIGEPKLFGLFELSKVLRGVLVLLAAFVFVRSERELAILVVAIGCAVCLEGALGLKQRYLNDVYRVTGTIDHSNSLSMYLCLVTPVLAAAATSDWAKPLRWFCWICVGVAGMTMLLTISRAGIPILAAVLLGTLAWCASWRVTPAKVAAVLLAALVTGLMVFRSWDMLKARYTEATLEEEYLDPTADGRGLYLRIAWAVLTDHPLGVGLNNWSYAVSKSYGGRFDRYYEDYDDLDYTPSKEVLASFHYAAPAHNLAALTAGELGWPGLFLFVWLWGRWMLIGTGFLWRRISTPMHRIGVGIFFGVCGVFLQSLTEWTYRQTPILFTCHALVGVLAVMHWHRLRARQRSPRRLEHYEPELVGAETSGVPVM